MLGLVVCRNELVGGSTDGVELQRMQRTGRGEDENLGRAAGSMATAGPGGCQRRLGLTHGAPGRGPVPASWSLNLFVGVRRTALGAAAVPIPPRPDRLPPSAP
ncbi:unnamed protein product [Gadus morhua 'NCC']